MNDRTYFFIKKDDVTQLICALESQLERDIGYVKQAAENNAPFDLDDLVGLVEDYQATKRLMEAALAIEKTICEERTAKQD